ncbi:MAG: hypothetical protein M5U26_01485 [Planctomycetota bacterium]|nr:hypothetical protein [Planctomycetota bacterium]
MRRLGVLPALVLALLGPLGAESPGTEALARADGGFAVELASAGPLLCLTVRALDAAAPQLDLDAPRPRAWPEPFLAAGGPAQAATPALPHRARPDFRPNLVRGPPAA